MRAYRLVGSISALQGGAPNPYTMGMAAPHGGWAPQSAAYPPVCMYMCIDMCEDMRIDMFGDMCINMCADMRDESR